MTRTTDDYLALIPPMNAGAPKFRCTVALSVDPLARLQAALGELATVDFDLDSAVGPQLDAVGRRVGITRFVPYPLQGLFFTWGDPIRGWGAGVWKGPYDAGTSIYRLDDDTFRNLIRAKVLANRWDGTIDGEAAILAAYFTNPATLVFVSDDSYSAQPASYLTWGDPARGWGMGSWAPRGAVANAPSLTTVDMKMTIGIAGKIPSVIDLALLEQGLIGAKPEGVTTQHAVTSVDGAPLFGFGVQNQYISGWGTGAWAVQPSALLLGLTPGILVTDDGFIIETDDRSQLLTERASSINDLSAVPVQTDDSMTLLDSDGSIIQTSVPTPYPRGAFSNDFSAGF